tara:strand:- start:1176 stop:1538 length:363 start_codon:yes stop_codon:yes gene_type:complete
MASTRNNNTPGNYCVQQESYRNAFNYTEFKNSPYGQAYNNALPTLGITPSHMPRSILSNNSVEIESSLFGINSTNLVNPQQPVIPNLKNLPEVSYFKKLPTFMPEPLVVQKNQRPFPIPK